MARTRAHTGVVPRKPVALIVLDGWGHRDEPENNGIAQARTPFYDSLLQHFPHTLLDASEESAGLPKGQIGNSEVGHMTIGAGTTIDTSLVRINKAIAGGEFHENPVFKKLFDHVNTHDSSLHVMGLVSPGGIHSHSDHLYAFLDAAKKARVERVVIHAFTDGRDTPPRIAHEYLRELETVLSKLGIGHIATVSGRFYSMDRDNNWHRLEKFESALRGEAPKHSRKPSDVIAEMYPNGALDEHFEPMVFLETNGNVCALGDDDAVFVFNYRADRVRMLTHMLMKCAENKNILIATMTEYKPEYDVAVAFPPRSIETTLAAEVSKAGLRQAHIAETEKFPHATYFLNGGRNEPHEGEEHIMLESRKDVPTHDLAPKMRAEGIADAAVRCVERGDDFIFINFANADMVGHTGNVPAIIEAVEEIDMQLKKVVDAISKAGGTSIITSDHGNAEINVDPDTGEKHTAHTLSRVPCIVTDASCRLREPGTLADIAPTTLELLGLQKPKAMTGNSLLIP